MSAAGVLRYATQRVARPATQTSLLKNPAASSRCYAAGTYCFLFWLAYCNARVSDLLSLYMNCFIVAQLLALVHNCFNLLWTLVVKYVPFIRGHEICSYLWSRIN